MYVVISHTNKLMLRPYVLALKEDEKRCISLLNNFDVNEYRSSLPVRVGGTCRWVLQSQPYESWVEESQASLLWVTGPSGYGKTTLSSFLINHLTFEGNSTREESLVCYFFCVDGIESTKDAKDILRSIIFQILVKRPDLVQHAMPFFRYDNEGTRLFKSYNSLWSMFTDILFDIRLKSVTIVIDAVDECEKASSNRLMESIAKLIERLRAEGSRSVKFWINSRPYVTIVHYFRIHRPQHLALDEKQVEIDGDLRRVIRERVRIRAELANAKQDTIDRWERSLTETADRTFFWTKFILDILDEELLTSPGDFDRILRDIPRDLKATYARFLQRIVPDRQDVAITLLRLVIASSRPLSVNEINTLVSLQEAKGADCQDLKSLKRQFLHTNMESDTNIILGPLIRIVKSKVYLAHMSLKEFLCTSILDYPDRELSARYGISLGKANLSLASACMRYLALEDFKRDLYTMPEVGTSNDSLSSSRSSPLEQEANSQIPRRDTDMDDDCGMLENLLQESEEIDAQKCVILAQKYTLFEYSALNWARHFANSQDLADSFLKGLALLLSDGSSQYQCENWFRFYWINSMDQWTYPRDFEQSVIAAFFDHFNSLTAILTDKRVDQRSLSLGLFWASRNGNHRSVETLMTTGIDPDLDTVLHQNSLSATAEFGHCDVVRVLVEKGNANVNGGEAHGMTPLLMAAMNGHTDTVKLLLTYEHVKIDIEASKGRTPLFYAISGHHAGVTGILASDPRVDVNHLDADDLTPFALAAEEGDEEIVGLLLKTPGINVDQASKSGRTPLSRAAQSGHSSMIKQLKRSGRLDVQKSHRDNTGRNAYSWAASGGHNDAINLLLRYALPGIDEEDEYLWTPLFWALEAPTSSTVETLIRTKKINVNHRDHSGRTALSWTVAYGNEKILRILLDAPVIDPLIPDQHGLTALDWARKDKDRSSITSILEDYIGKQEVSLN